MGVAFAREPFAQAWTDIQPLVDAHWREVAYPGDTAPAIDVPAYTEANLAGRLVVFTVRDGTGLVGYATFWIGPFPQRQGQIGAWQDAVYLTPNSRHGGSGTDFLRFCDAELEAMGCHVVHHSVREGRDFSTILRRLGYVHAETVYAKHLGA
jgi:L-amino acid N-acyltransferase YncA